MSDFNTQDTSIESMNEMKIQPGPNLCTELEKVFQEVIDFKKSLTVEYPSDKCRMVVNYIRNTAGKKMLSVIKQYTGLNLELHLYRNFTCGFSVWWYFSKVLTKNDNATVITLLDRMSGKLPNSVYQKYAKKYENVKTQEELEAISREVIKDKGAVTLGMQDKYNLNGRLYFCPFAAFLVQESYEYNVEAFTAKELAAIIAHECGHVISFFLCISDTYHKYEILYNAAKQYYFSAPQDIQNRIALSTMKHYFPDQTEKIMKKLEEYKEHHTSSSSRVVGNMVYAIFALALKLIFGLFKVGIMSIWRITKGLVMGPIEHAMSYNPEKRSDLLHGTSADGLMEEELADAYVAKMGYSAHLVHALDKIRKWERYTGGYTNTSGPSMMTRLRPWLIATLFKGYDEDGVHPDEFKRVENAMMDTIKAFKDADCPSELLNDYLEAYKDIKSLSEDNSFERKWQVANKAINRAFNYLISTPYELLYSARFKQEYETLFRQVRQLMDNQIYALAYGLKQKEQK